MYSRNWTHLLGEMWVLQLYVHLCFPPGKAIFTHRCQDSSLSHHPMALPGQGRGADGIGRFLAVHRSWLLLFALLSISLHILEPKIIQILMPFLCFSSSWVPLLFYSLILISRLLFSCLIDNFTCKLISLGKGSLKQFRMLLSQPLFTYLS